MELTLDQKDALTELINIGYGRAAGALSELTGYRITLEVPQVTMHEISTVGPMLEQLIRSNVASVDQGFSGPISGTALLVLDEEAAHAVSQLLSEDGAKSPAGSRGTLDSNAREIITEVGNILLNACLGVFGNLLRVPISFAVPKLQVAGVTAVLNSVGRETRESLDYGLMIHTRFLVKTNNFAGYMVIVLGVNSLERLLAELKKWEERQGQ
jgi:chemotaxis protein CheC